MNALAPIVPALLEPRPHLFSVDDVRTLVQAGVIEEGARVELIEGVLSDMPSEGAAHNDWSAALGRWLFGGLGRDFVIVPGSTLVLSPQNAPKPDWYVFDAALATAEVRGGQVLLAIEQAQSILARDLGWKADLYARHGVRDYWVIDIDRRELHVHRDPTAEGYGFRQRFAADAEVAALLIPGLALRLDRLPRVGDMDGTGD